MQVYLSDEVKTEAKLDVMMYVCIFCQQKSSQVLPLEKSNSFKIVVWEDASCNLTVVLWTP